MRKDNNTQGWETDSLDCLHNLERKKQDRADYFEDQAKG